MAGSTLKGAFISFSTTFGVPLPNVVVFQFNPETITHTWTPPPGTPSPNKATEPKANPLAVRSAPGETFSFSLALDALDMIADGATNPIGAGLASVSGVYSRLAAMELLLFPEGFATAELVGTVSAALGLGGSKSSSDPIPAMQVPPVLFVWGAQRIVPVRLTTLTITERIYDASLNPTHADVQVGLTVLTKEEIQGIGGLFQTLCLAAYDYTLGLRTVQAAANLGDAAASIIGMLPIPL